MSEQESAVPPDLRGAFADFVEAFPVAEEAKFEGAWITLVAESAHEYKARLAGAIRAAAAKGGK